MTSCLEACSAVSLISDDYIIKTRTLLPKHAGRMLTAPQSAGEVASEAAECRRARGRSPRTFGPQCSCSEGLRSGHRQKTEL